MELINNLIFRLSVLLVLFGSPIFAQEILVTIGENPLQSSTSLQHTEVFDFEDLDEGYHSKVIWTDVGLFDQLFVNQSSGYGAYDPGNNKNSKFNWMGRFNSQFPGPTAFAPSTTLTLNKFSSYFGMYWSAADGNDRIAFYQDGNLVGEFTTKFFLQQFDLSDEYFGDPHFGVNRREPYLFVNFYAGQGADWNRIDFSQTGPGGGFEIDNLALLTSPFSLSTGDNHKLGRVVAILNGEEAVPALEKPDWIFDSGMAVPTPEPKSYLLLSTFLVFVLLMKRGLIEKEKSCGEV